MGDIERRLKELLVDCIASGPVSTETIAEAETRLGLWFPPSYRQFLMEYGAILASDIEVAGLPPKQTNANHPPMWQDVVDVTEIYRRHNALPDDSIYISTDGTDRNYFLSCSRSEPNFEGVVIEWGPDHDGGIEHSVSFVAFLERHFGR